MTIKKVKLYRFFYLVAIFLLIYAPFLSLAGFTIHLPYLFTFFCSLIFLITVLSRGVVSKMYLVFISLYWVGGIWIYSVGWLHQNIDKSILYGYIPGTLAILAAYPIVKFFSLRIATSNVNFIIRAIYICGLIHAVIMVLAFFVAPFRNILYSVVSLGDKGEAFVELMVRSPGLTTGGGDALSVIQAIALIFGIYYFIEIRRQFSITSSITYLLSFVVLLLSILLSARTGLIIVLAFLLGLTVYKIIKVFWSLKISRSIVSKALVILFSVAILIPVGYNYLMNSEYKRFANRAFELYINYVESGELGTSSSNTLQDMYFFPDEKQHLFFGDGNFGRDAHLPYLTADIGYIRTIFGVGIVGTLVLFAPLVYVFVIACRNYKRNKHLCSLILIVLGVIFITNFKVFHYFEFRESFKTLYLLLASLSLVNIRNIAV